MVAVFHHIGDIKPSKMEHSLQQILDYPGGVTFDGAYIELWKLRHKLAVKEPLLFVQGNTVGKSGVMDWPQIIELGQIGWTLGWHGWTHRKLIDLPNWVVRWELDRRNKGFISDYYAYPHGEFDERAKRLVEEAGFIEAYSTTQGDDSDFAIRREYL